MSKISYRCISQEDVIKIFTGKTDKFYEIVEESFKRFDRGDVLMPDKISQIFNQETQNRINCMPATLLDENVSGMKWVSVFPTNSAKGLQNVSGVIILSEIESGFPLAVIDGTLLTSIRTAAVGCVAAKHLAPSKVENIGFIGGGTEAKMHFTLLKHMFPTIKECRISSRKESTERNFVSALQDAAPDVKFITCKGDSFRSVNNADIIITAISGQAPVLKAKYITKGCLYIHVGGWEDEFAVVEKADKIICDEWKSCKHRTQTLSRMYVQGLLHDNDIYADLKDIICKRKKGRENDNEFIYFNSVGLSFIDLQFAKETYNIAKQIGVGREEVLCDITKVAYNSFI